MISLLKHDGYIFEVGQIFYYNADKETKDQPYSQIILVAKYDNELRFSWRDELQDSFPCDIDYVKNYFTPYNPHS